MFKTKIKKNWKSKLHEYSCATGNKSKTYQKICTYNVRMFISWHKDKSKMYEGNFAPEKSSTHTHTLVSASPIWCPLIFVITFFFILDGMKWRFSPSAQQTNDIYIVAHHTGLPNFHTQTPFHLIASWQIACRIEWMNKSNSVCVCECVYQHRKYTSQIMIYIHFGACFVSFRNSMIVMQTHTHTHTHT